MRKKIVIAAVIAFVVGALLGPPDAVSQLIFGVMAGVLCGVSLLILARFAFVRSTSGPMQTLVCVLVCMVSVLAVFCYMLVLRVTRGQERFSGPPAVPAQP